MTTIFSTLVEFFVNIISNLGIFGIYVGMTIESSFFPFPSEVILPPAGVLIARGELSFIIVLLAAILGSITGALINYYIALFLGRRTINKIILKYGKFLFLTEKHLLKSEKYFEKHGEITTFLGRLIPAIRQLISLPAGFSRMHLKKFITFTALGAGIWSFILIYIGVIYGENQEAINSNLSSITIVLLAMIVIILAIYFYYKRKPTS